MMLTTQNPWECKRATLLVDCISKANVICCAIEIKLCIV